MFKKVMKYVDFDGVERTETFYFNLTEAEALEMEVSEEGGLSEFAKRISEAKDQKALIKLFKDLILKSYGVKSPDGKRLIKNDEVREAFSQTQAYSDLFIELATNTEVAMAFVNGIGATIKPLVAK